MSNFPDAPGAAPEPASPCTGVCVLDERGYCFGCERHIDEIVGWPRMTSQGKHSLLAELPERRQRRAAPPG